MKKRILGVALAVVMAVCLVGCGQEVQNESKEDNSSMFVCIEQSLAWIVVYHRDTKVMYAVSRYGSGSGEFTLLVDADGNPMLWESED